MRRVVLAVIILLSPLFLLAQEMSISSWLDTNRILLGDQLNFNIEIHCEQDAKITIPVFSDTIQSGIEIISVSGPDTTITGDNKLKINTKYLITSFDTGIYDIEPVFIEESDSTGVRREYSDYLRLEVIRVDIMPSDSSQVIFDIRGPRKAGLGFMEVFPWVLLGLVIAFLAWYIQRYLRKKKVKPIEEEPGMPSEPVHIIALRDLDKLEREELWQKARHKLYHSRLTEILRIYIDHFFGISCLEMTTFETLAALKKSGFNNDDLYEILSDILSVADMSKFARYKAEAEVNIKSMENARIFVRETSRQRAREENITAGKVTEGKEVANEQN
ncbi:MAG: hypothetical protein V2I37_12770 [Marinilabiliaceae bacterium]|jgi:hypothetical protein|nr:hypothetical protein [Marinilabiliaceae bacterium]